MMKKIFLACFVLMTAVMLESCSTGAHCPGVTGTGNTATRSHKSSKAHCPGNASTGTFKPKVKASQAKENGNFDPKMERQMAKAQRGKKPQNVKLSAE